MLRVFIKPDGTSAPDKLIYFRGRGEDRDLEASEDGCALKRIGLTDLGVPTRYVVQDRNIHAIMRISTPQGERKRSLFVGDTIIAGTTRNVHFNVDGTMYIVTRQDILFHILPHLHHCAQGHSRPLQDIIDALPLTLQFVEPELLMLVCECTPSTHPLVPDTYKLSPLRVLAILRKKVDALIPVLGSSLQAEFIDKKIAVPLGHPCPTDMDHIRSLARTKCAVDVISGNLDAEITLQLTQSYEYSP
jgi:hypothetical protein